MDRNRDEQLSALFDAELSEFENRKLLTEVTRDDETGKRLARYQLIGDAIRAENGAPVVKADFAEAISARLDSADEVDLAGPEHLPRKWLKTASGLAIAASVALMAIYLAPRYFSSELDGGFSTSAGIAATSRTNPRSGGTRWETVTPETERQLNRYLVNHGEYASEKGMNHVVPYATFVSYDVER